MIKSKQERYAVYSKNPTTRALSSSGGFVGTLAEKTLNAEGVVYGAAYVDGFKHVKTIRVDNISDYFKLVAKSKYSYCQDCDFNSVKKDLEEGKKVLFTGCPCQVKRLKEFLKTEYDNLTTLDLFCYGYSEPRILENFISEVENDTNSEVVSLDMRKNHKHLCQVTFKNGVSKEYDNVFEKFVCKGNLMQMCRECDMHKGNNVSDITVGDFWDWRSASHPPKFNPRNGTNVVVLNTDIGK
jgi:coenzyme F420-reducing hydrogenase beta subunit